MNVSSSCSSDGVCLVSVLVVALAIGGTAQDEGATKTANGRQTHRSYFNDLELDPSEEWDSYSFLLMGHLRSNPDVPSPNETLRLHASRLMEADPDFVVAMGDLYSNLSEHNTEEFKSWVADSVDVPFFNAAGNHDIQVGGDLLEDGTRTPRSISREAYAEVFGPCYFDFTIGSEMFVFLDFAIGYTFSREQFEYFKDVIKRARSNDAVRNVFVVTHKVVWSYRNPDMKSLFRYRHPVKPPGNPSYFATVMRPILLPLAKKKDVYLLAGDIGGGSMYLQMYYHRDEDFTYVATGMGMVPRDCFVDVSVNEGVVTMKAVILTTGESVPVEHFGNDHWDEFYRTHPAEATAADRE